MLANDLIYTGVGSRATPQETLDFITDIATQLAQDGFTLRSGGAIGADHAFELGCKHAHGDAVIYRPEHVTGQYGRLALDMARVLHPAWSRCSTYVQKLHARNMFQVLGSNLDTPSQCVICWTPDGAVRADECTRVTGGTAMAIRCATMHNVPVINLNLSRDGCIRFSGEEAVGFWETYLGLPMRH